MQRALAGLTSSYGAPSRHLLLHRHRFTPLSTSISLRSGFASMASKALPERAHAVLQYWFGSDYATADNSFVPREKMGIWFKGGKEVDQYITEHFAQDVQRVAQGEYDSWRSDSPLALLAGIILMDQFTRNIHRGSPAVFSLDAQALSWSDHAVATGWDQKVPAAMRMFVYMPCMHAEDLAAQERGVQLFTSAAEATAAQCPACEAAANGLRMALSAAVSHRDVVAAWGRFPHRNAVLGRASTPQEEAGLADGSIQRWG